jgi:hypothetical protein
MRLATLSLVSMIAILSGCKDPTPSYKAPEIKRQEVKIPSGTDFKLPIEFMVCDKVEANVSKELTKHPLNTRGFTDLQDMEGTDCDGKKTTTPKMPLNNFNANLTIDPPAGIKSNVNFAIVENTRTCSSRRVTFKAGEVNPLGTPVWADRPYFMDEHGRITLGMIDSPFLLRVGLNVANGQNILNITYYGRCLDAVKAAATTAGECEKGEELARKSVLVNAEIEKREIDGVYQIDSCTKPKVK